MNFRVLLAASVADMYMAADDGDGLKLALAAKPTVKLSVYLDPDLSRSLTAEQVTIDAELILRQNHVSIASKDGDASGILLISARVTTLTLSRAMLYAVLPAIDYIEPVSPGAALVKCALDNLISVEKAIGCTDHHTVHASLWRKDTVMQIGEDRLPGLREKLRDLTKEFALQYLRANEPTK